jgi:hypothetical protein
MTKQLNTKKFYEGLQKRCGMEPTPDIFKSVGGSSEVDRYEFKGRGFMKAEEPMLQDECVCGHKIIHSKWIFNTITGQCISIGTICYDKFMKGLVATNKCYTKTCMGEKANGDKCLSCYKNQKAILLEKEAQRIQLLLDEHIMTPERLKELLLSIDKFDKESSTYMAIRKECDRIERLLSERKMESMRQCEERESERVRQLREKESERVRQVKEKETERVRQLRERDHKQIEKDQKDMKIAEDKRKLLVEANKKHQLQNDSESSEEVNVDPFYSWAPFPTYIKTDHEIGQAVIEISQSEYQLVLDEVIAFEKRSDTDAKLNDFRSYLVELPDEENLPWLIKMKLDKLKSKFGFRLLY